MRKYRVFVCAVLILCFFSFHISRPRQALAIVPAVSLAAAAVLAVGAAAGLSYTFDNADAESIAGRLQAFLDDVHPGTSIANYFSARGAAVKDGLMYIGRSLYNRIKEFLQWESNGLSSGSTVTVSHEDGKCVILDGSEIVLGNVIKYGTSNKHYVSEYDSTIFNFPTDATELQNWTDLIVRFTSLCWAKISVEPYYNASNELKGVCYKLYGSSDGGNTYSLTGSENIVFSRQAFCTFCIVSTGGHDFLSCYHFRRDSRISTVNSPYYDYCQFIGSNYYSSNFRLWDLTTLGSSWANVYIPASSLTLTASDVISYPDVLDGQSVCVDVGMLTGSTIDDVADEIIDAAIDGTLSPSITAETWTVDVVATPQELAQDLDTDLTTEVEDNPTVPDSETIEFDTPSHYSVRDLRQFFPFCIPFDLFDMLGVLAAQPVAPHFEYRFQPGIANIDYTIVIDFQQFNSVALLLRRLETLSFCIGLAMVTRNLIRG